MSEKNTNTDAIRVALIASRATVGEYLRNASRFPNVKWNLFCSTGADATTDVDNIDTGELIDCHGSCEKLYSNYADQFDVVVIHEQRSHRSSLVKQAIALGKHVFVEAPSAWNRQDIQDLYQQSCQANVCLKSVHPLRFHSAVQAMKLSLDSRKLGEPGLLRIHRWKKFQPDDAVLKADGISSDEWLARDSLANLDLARYLFAMHPNTIYTVAQQKDEGGTPDYLQLHLGFDGGGMALIDHFHTMHGQNEYESISLIGSTGAAYADDHHNRQLLFGRESSPSAISTNQGDWPRYQAFADFINQLKTYSSRNETTSDIQSECELIDILDGLKTSLTAREPVVWRGGRYEQQ